MSFLFNAVKGVIATTVVRELSKPENQARIASAVSKAASAARAAAARRK